MCLAVIGITCFKDKNGLFASNLWKCLSEHGAVVSIRTEKKGFLNVVNIFVKQFGSMAGVYILEHTQSVGFFFGSGEPLIAIVYLMALTAFSPSFPSYFTAAVTADVTTELKDLRGPIEHLVMLIVSQ